MRLSTVLLSVVLLGCRSGDSDDGAGPPPSLTLDRADEIVLLRSLYAGARGTVVPLGEGLILVDVYSAVVLDAGLDRQATLVGGIWYGTAAVVADTVWLASYTGLVQRWSLRSGLVLETQDLRTFQYIPPEEGDTGSGDVLYSSAWPLAATALATGGAAFVVEDWDFTPVTYRLVTPDGEALLDACGQAAFTAGGGHVVCLSTASDGTRLLEVIPTDLVSLPRRVELPAVEDEPSYGTRLLVSPDGRRALLSTFFVLPGLARVELVDLESREVLRTAEAAGSPIVWSPDGTMVLVGGEDGAVDVWDASSLVPVSSGQIREVDSLAGIAWLPDQRIVTSTASGFLSVWGVR